MTCDLYRRYRMDAISSREFAAHADGCRECSETLAADERIEQAARAIPAPASAPGLWERIAADIGDGQRTQAPWPLRLVRAFDPRFQPRRRLAGLTAAVAAAAVIVFALPFQAGPRPANLLNERALARVEALEAEYAQAIAELEPAAEDAMADVDVALRLHYRDRLETIDAQIRRCRAVLDGDRANAHVRRYLMAAYRDKRETLAAMLALSRS